MTTNDDLSTAYQQALKEFTGPTEVEQLRAELAKVREQLTAANRRADGLEADLRSANTANTAWANQGQPCLIVKCAHCDEPFEQDGITIHFASLDDAKSIAGDEDWRFVDGEVICGNCVYKPHAFKPDGLDVLTCQRCDLEEDDHEALTEKDEPIDPQGTGWTQGDNFRADAAKAEVAS